KQALPSRGSTVSVATAALAVFAWFQSVEAEKQRAEAEVQRAEAVEQRAEAEAQKAEAELQRAEAQSQRAAAQESAEVAKRERDQALRTQSLFLADLSRQRLAAGDDGDALALALEAVPEAPEMTSRPLVPEAMEALREVYLNFRMKARLPKDFGFGMGLAAAPENDRLIMALSADGLVLNFAKMDLETAYSGYENGATAAAYSPVGDSFAIGARNGLVTVFDAQTLDPLSSFDVDEPVLSLAYSPSGQLVAIGPAADDESRPIVFGARNGELLHRLESHGGDVSGIGFTPEGEHLLTTSHDGAARIFRLADGRLLGGVHSSKYGLNGMAMRPGTAIAAFAESEAVVLVDLTKGEVIETFAVGLTPFELTWGPGGDLYVGYIDGSILRWREGESEPVGRFVGHQETILALSASADGERLFSASSDEALLIWLTDHDVARKHLDREYDASSAYGFDDGIEMVVATHREGAALTVGEAEPIVLPLGAELADAGLGADHISTIDKNGRVDIWSLAGQHSGGFETGLSDQSFAKLLRGGALVQTWGPESGAALWRYPSGERIPLSDERLATSHFAGTGDRAVFATGAKTEWLDLSGGDVARHALDGVENPTTVAISPDGGLVAIGVNGSPAVIYALPSGEAVTRLPSRETSSRKLIFSPDGQYLAAAGVNSSVAIWRVSDWALIRVAQVRDHVSDLVFSDDSALLAISGIDGQVEVLRSVDGKRHFLYPDATGTGASLVFSADAKRLLARSTSGVTIYDVLPDDVDLITKSAKRAGMVAPLTDEDRCRYFLSVDVSCSVETVRDRIVVTLPDFE
ncbi:MAG: WD40 repeat domain-containing protein, partial [Pikeienuella sp.]